MEASPNINKLFENIEQCNKELLRNNDVEISDLQGIGKLKDEYKYLGDMFMVDFIKLKVFNQRYLYPRIDMPPLNVLFGVLESIQRLEKCAPPEFKMYLKMSALSLVYVMIFVGSWENGTGELVQYKQDLYDRINDLGKDSIFRKVFLEAYNHNNTYGAEIEKNLIKGIKTEIMNRMEPWERYSDEVYHYMASNKFALINSSEGITALIGAINTAYRVSKDLKAPQGTKSTLIWLLRISIWPFMVFGETCFTSELFNRRNEIAKDNMLRNYIIFYYAQNEAMDKFKDKEIEKFEECLGELYRQYREEEMLTWDMEKEDHYWEETLPEPVKKALAEEEAKRDREHEWVLEVLRKHEELKVSKGITNDEALALLTEGERGILDKRGYIRS